MGAWISIKYGDGTGLHINSTWTEGRYASELVNFGQCEAQARHYLAHTLDEDSSAGDVRDLRRLLDYLTSAGNYPGEYADGEPRCIGAWTIEIGVDGYLADDVTARLRDEQSQRQAEIAARVAGGESAA